jgi:hypothetical protein
MWNYHNWSFAVGYRNLSLIISNRLMAVNIFSFEIIKWFLKCVLKTCVIRSVNQSISQWVSIQLLKNSSVLFLLQDIMDFEKGSSRSHALENPLWKMQFTCRNTNYMMMRLMMMMMMMMMMIPEKYCRVKYKKCCTFLHFFTLKNVQVIQEEGVWRCTLRPKMSFWISDWACNQLWIWQAWCGCCTTGFHSISCVILACLPRTEWRQTGARCVRILDVGPTA